MRNRWLLIAAIIASMIPLWSAGMPISYAQTYHSVYLYQPRTGKPLPPLTAIVDQTKSLPSLQVLVNARRVKFPDVKPQVRDGRVLVPLRFVSEALGGKLSLTGNDITIVKGDRTAKLTIGAKVASTNNAMLTLDVPPDVVNGRTLVPLRFISDALGESIEWDRPNQYVWIGSKKVPLIEDVEKPVDPSEMKRYITTDPYLKEDFAKGQINKLYVVSADDFPLEVSKTIYYRINPAIDKNGNELIRLSSTTDYNFFGAGLPLDIYKDGGGDFYMREEDTGHREQYGNDRVQYNYVISYIEGFIKKDDSYNRLKMKDLDYVSFTMLDSKDPNPQDGLDTLPIFIRADTIRQENSR